MSTNQKTNQSGQGSKIDHGKSEDANPKTKDEKTNKEEIEEIEAIDDDFLSGDNQKKVYPNDQNNPMADYNKKSLSPNPNPNIGGDENEYEKSTPDDEGYDEDIASNTEDDDDSDEENKGNDNRDSPLDFDLFLEF